MANKKIRQEINLTNVEADPIDSIEAFFGGGGLGYFVSADYTGATFYYEVIVKNSNASDRTLVLYGSSNGNRTAMDSIRTITVPANTNNWTRLRSLSFTPSGTYPYVMSYTSNDTDISIKSAKIIILQDAAEIYKTKTQIEIGQYATIVPAAENTWYQIPEPKYWKYEASKWDATTKTVKLGLTFGCEDDKESYNFGLYDVTDADYAGGNLQDLITGVSTETVTYYESADFFSYLEDGHIYCLAYEGDDDKDDMYFYNAKIIFTLSDGTSIDALQTEYLLINDAQADTGSQEFMTLHDADEWDDGGGNPPTLYHEHSADSASSNTKLEDSGGDITDSSITGAGLQRSSAITLTDDEEIDANIVTA